MLSQEASTYQAYCNYIILSTYKNTFLYTPRFKSLGDIKKASGSSERQYVKKRSTINSYTRQIGDNLDKNYKLNKLYSACTYQKELKSDAGNLKHIV